MRSSAATVIAPNRHGYGRGHKLVSGMPARRPRHHTERHQADGTHGPGVEGGGAAKTARDEDADSAKQKAQRHETIAHVQHEQQRLAPGAEPFPTP